MKHVGSQVRGESQCELAPGEGASLHGEFSRTSESMSGKALGCETARVEGEVAANVQALPEPAPGTCEHVSFVEPWRQEGAATRRAAVTLPLHSAFRKPLSGRWGSEIPVGTIEVVVLDDRGRCERSPAGAPHPDPKHGFFMLSDQFDPNPGGAMEGEDREARQPELDEPDLFTWQDTCGLHAASSCESVLQKLERFPLACLAICEA